HINNQYHRELPCTPRVCNRSWCNHQDTTAPHSQLSCTFEQNGYVMHYRPFEQLSGHDDPNDKDNCCAKNEPRWVQIDLRYSQCFVGRNDSSILPRVEVRKSEKDWHE